MTQPMAFYILYQILMATHCGSYPKRKTTSEKSGKLLKVTGDHRLQLL